MTAFVTQPDSTSPLSGSGGHTISSSPKPYVAVDSSESDWPLSDFIRQHIIENKLDTDAMTRKEFKRTVSRSKMTTLTTSGAANSGSGETAARQQYEGISIPANSSNITNNNKRSTSRPRSGRVPSPTQSAFIAEQHSRKSPSYAFLTGSRDDNDNEQVSTGGRSLVYSCTAECSTLTSFAPTVPSSSAADDQCGHPESDQRGSQFESVQQFRQREWREAEAESLGATAEQVFRRQRQWEWQHW